MILRLILLSLLGALTLIPGSEWLSFPVMVVQKPSEYFFLQRQYPDFGFPREAFDQAMEAARAQTRLRSASPPGFEENWILRGPGNVAGRVNVVAIDPKNDNILYVGLASGGVFKSINGGQTWSPIFDGQAYLAIGAIAIDPSNSNVIYVGTGDPNISAYPAIGDGLYRSADGGKTWEFLGLKPQRIISRIILDPLDPKKIYVGCMGIPFERNNDRGVYISRDGGKTWQQSLFVSNQTGITDLVMDPFDSRTLYAAAWDRIRTNRESIVSGPNSKVFKTSDGGATWKSLTNGFPTGANFGRIALAVSRKTPGLVFARIVGEDRELLNIYRSRDAGENWEQVIDWGRSNLARIAAMGGNSLGWYFGRMAINPENDFELYLLGVDLYKSRNGGINWDMAAPPWYRFEVHADKHHLEFAKNGDLYLATDGGLFRQRSGSGDWERLGYLPATQFYRIAYNPHRPDTYYGGAQDNGSLEGQSFEQPWKRIYPGDGFQMVFHPLNPKIAYLQREFSQKLVTVDSGLTWLSANTGQTATDRANWDAPLAISSHNPNVMYCATDRVYRSPAGHPPNWGSISPDLTDGNIFGRSFHTVSAFEESPKDSTLLFAGTSDGNVWRIDKSIGDWIRIHTGLPERYITDIEASPSYRDRVFVSVSGYRDNDFTPHIFLSKDLGKTWLSIAANLPPLAINDMLVLPEHQDSIIFVATDGGVYATNSGGKEWFRLGKDFPFVPVYDLEWNQKRQELVAGSYGRSIFSYPLEKMLAKPVIVSSSENRSITKEGVRIFPNPTPDMITVSFELPLSGTLLATIHDNQGKLLFSRQLEKGTEDARFNLGSYPPGIYHVRISGPDGTISKKISVF